MKLREETDLSAFFDPASVVVAGSLREVPGTAFWVIRNMRHFGYSGKIYAVNPNPDQYGDVLGCPVYSSIEELPGPVDLAAVITPPGTVPGIVAACAEKRVRAVIVMSEGFAESGPQGEDLQRELTEIAGRTGIRIMGPNTFGTVNAANGLATIPPYTDQERLVAGGVAFCSQTGSIGPHQNPVADWAYPISKMCDVGNKCDVDEADLLEYLAGDEETRVVALHLEDIRSAPRFLSAVRALTARKPLVVLKTGRSEGGARAALSHTGSMMGNDRVVEAALRQAGALRVRTWEELWEIPKTLVFQPLPAGNRFAVITLTGGQGVIAADAAEDAGLRLAAFSPDTVRRLTRISPRLGGNPVDIGPVMSDSRSQSSDNPFSAVEETVPLVLDDENVDCLTISFYGGKQIVPMYPMIVEMLDRLARDTSKTVNIWIYGTSTSAMEELARRLQACGLPAYLDLDLAIRSLGASARVARWRTRRQDPARD